MILRSVSNDLHTGVLERYITENKNCRLPLRKIGSRTVLSYASLLSKDEL